MSNHINVSDFPELAEGIGQAVKNKHMSYGGALDVAPEILTLLYPDCVTHDQMFEFECVSRIVEKLCRICRGNPEAFNESPWEDIIGYSLHALKGYYNGKEGTH